MLGDSLWQLALRLYRFCVVLLIVHPWAPRREEGLYVRVVYLEIYAKIKEFYRRVSVEEAYIIRIIKL